MTKLEIEKAGTHYAEKRREEAELAQIDRPKSERKSIDFASAKYDFIAGAKYVLNLIKQQNN